MKVGFIGSGNMANAIIKGMLSAQVVKAEEISVFDIDTAKQQAVSDHYGVVAASTLETMIEDMDILVLAVKPIVFPTLLPAASKMLRQKNPLIISIAAGKTLDYISGLLGYPARLVRVMPNINAKVSAAMNAYCVCPEVTEEDKKVVELIFGATGTIMALEESFFPLYGVIAGSAPAFAYMFIDALARAGVKNGMNKQAALDIAAQTVYGSAKMILESDEHPWSLVDQVCSPGGTTIEGVTSLQNDRFDAAITRAVDACVAKDAKI